MNVSWNLKDEVDVTRTITVIFFIVYLFQLIQIGQCVCGGIFTLLQYWLATGRVP